MSEPTKKAGNPGGAKVERTASSSEFDSFFPKGEKSRFAAKELIEFLEFASETDKESEIFEEEAPAPTAPQAEAEPVAPAAPPPRLQAGAALLEARRRIESARGVREITDAMLAYGRSRFKRVGIFVSRAPHLDGWDADGSGWTREMIRQMKLPLDRPSVFQLFQGGGGYYLGPIPKTPTNDLFVKSTGGKRPKSCFIAPVILGQRVVNLLYGDNGHASEVGGDFSEFLLFFPLVGQAYERLIREKAQRKPKLRRQ